MNHNILKYLPLSILTVNYDKKELLINSPSINITINNLNLLKVPNKFNNIIIDGNDISFKKNKIDQRLDYLSNFIINLNLLLEHDIKIRGGSIDEEKYYDDILVFIRDKINKENKHGLK